MKKFLNWILDNTRTLFFLFGLVAAGLLVAGIAHAETVTVSWTHPTQYTNGAALPASDLLRTEVRCLGYTPTGVTARQPCPRGEAALLVPAPTNSTTYDLGTVPPAGGKFELDARTVVKSLAMSEWSLPGSKIFVAVPPQPPTNIVVTTGGSAYEIQHKPNGVRVVQVGTVVAGVECGGEVSTGYYEIDPASATLRGSYKGGTLVAQCEAT